MTCPLRRLQGFATERSLGFDTLARRSREIRDVPAKIGGALLDQPALLLVLSSACRLGRSMRKDGRNGLARIDQRILTLAAQVIEDCQIVERGRYIGVVRAKDLLLNF